MKTTTTRSSFLGCSLLLVLLAGCSAPTQKPAENATAKVPEDRDPRLLLERGKAYAEISDLVRAEQYLAAAVAAGAPDQQVIPPLLSVCVAQRHFRLAAEYAEAALARNPQSSRLRFLTGALYVSIGDVERARRHLEAAGAALGNDAEVQFSVAVFFRDELSDRVKADPYFRNYLRITPKGTHREEAMASVMEQVQ